VKITGANSASSADNVQQQPSGLPPRVSLAKNEGVGERVAVTANVNAPPGVVVEVKKSSDQDGKACDSGCDEAELVLAEDDAVVLEGTILPDSCDGNDGYLDLLVDALDGEFDPNLLI